MKQHKISRRSFMSAMGIFGASAALTACSGFSASSASAEASADASAPLIDPAEYPFVDGSTACIPLIADMQHRLTGEDLTEIQSGISVNTTAYAWENISIYFDSDYDYSPRVLIVYEAPEYVQEEIAEAGIDLEITPIGRDALVFMVNEQNPVESLTREQLIDIYSGKITNWKEVGGDDLEIMAFQRSEDSGSQTLFRKLLMGDTEPADAPTELAPASMGGLVDALAAYNNSGNAIGFSVYYYIDQMYSKPGLRLMNVDGITPSNETIGNSTYPLCNEFYAVIRADEPEGSPARIIYDWICSENGKACIEDNGYVPAT